VTPLPHVGEVASTAAPRSLGEHIAAPGECGLVQQDLGQDGDGHDAEGEPFLARPFPAPPSTLDPIFYIRGVCSPSPTPNHGALPPVRVGPLPAPAVIERAGPTMVQDQQGQGDGKDAVDERVKSSWSQS
jgi:hypothetical protein